jgi:type II secretion system (T2SS) protein G
MKSIMRALLLMALALSVVLVATYARELGAREARQKIATAIGLDSADAIHIRNISRTGGEAIVEANVSTAFRLARDKSGDWQAVEFRQGDRQWESIELIQTAVRKEKALRTTAELQAIATALEAFRRDRGSYVQAASCSKLIDSLSPGYMNRIIRLDAWSRELQYSGTAESYRLASLGADGKPDTGDDIVFENGRLTKGADE